MGDLIRYPVMKTVKDAAAIYGLPPTYIPDPLPDRQDQVRCGRSPLAREYEQLGPVF